jgi:dienelactone hydrolase
MIIMMSLIAMPKVGEAMENVSFVASDQVEVFGDYYSAGTKTKPLLLLFHQAGSNRGEYEQIAPTLVALGFNALAIDQRSGGAMWGRDNETVRHLHKSSSYDEALRDLEAALKWAKSFGHSGPIAVWGSSYSAALVFVLAARHPQETNALLAFSPGEYLDGPSDVRKAATLLSLPVFVTSAKSKDEIDAARAILNATTSSEKTQFVPRVDGVHGSSTLRRDRNPRGADENWAAVKRFLMKVL